MDLGDGDTALRLLRLGWVDDLAPLSTSALLVLDGGTRLETLLAGLADVCLFLSRLLRHLVVEFQIAVELGLHMDLVDIETLVFSAVP